MTRRFMGVASVALVLAFGPELDACGDKSLASGGVRMQRAKAALYPASIVAYAPAGSRLPAAADQLKLQKTVRQYGHKYHEVATLAELRTSIASGNYNILLADVADAAALQHDIAVSGAGIVVVPIAHKPAKAEAKELSKQWRFTIQAPSRDLQYLNTIADAVASRQRGARGAA